MDLTLNLDPSTAWAFALAAFAFAAFMGVALAVALNEVAEAVADRIIAARRAKARRDRFAARLARIQFRR